MPLSEMLTPQARGAAEFTFTMPTGWLQGRGLFGGLVVGAMIRAMEHEVERERSLRSLTAELCGPSQPGPLTVRVERLREGSAVSTLTAQVIQNEAVQAHAVGVFGKARADTRALVDLPPVERPDWRTLEVSPVEPPFAPDFTRYFEFRAVSGAPFSAGREARTSTWLKPRHAGPARDAAWVAACADACWPGVFVIESGPRPMATISYTLQLVSGLDGLDPDAPLFHRGTVASLREGYAVEYRELWGEDGRLVALNQQTFAVIR